MTYIELPISGLIVHLLNLTHVVPCQHKAQTAECYAVLHFSSGKHNIISETDYNYLRHTLRGVK
jgi:hypothetical protein